MYYTDIFPSTANPIGSPWVNNGTLWTKCQSVANKVYGTQDGSGAFDDSFNLLVGFPANQSGEANIFDTVGTASDPVAFHEIEIWLRGATASTSATGYECTIGRRADNHTTYSGVTRWNGPFGDFTPFPDFGAVPGGFGNGDILRANIVGNTITMTIQHVGDTSPTTIGTVDITSLGGTVYSTGNPGIGFFQQGGAAGINTLGFSRFTATDLNPGGRFFSQSFGNTT